ncbi:MAG: hypothetical protein OSW77_07035 [Proteobacteria bacterium]|nr:hypothetical protein [Pseudomonadota bacterium]
MNTHRIAPRARVAGFGLVELMVGLVVGLITTLVITQVFASFEGQKRTTSGVGDIQTNGAFAVYQIEREVRMAGYGLVGTGGLLCPLGANVAVDAYAAPAAAPLAPAHIVDGGAGPDTLTVARSASPTTAIPGAGQHDHLCRAARHGRDSRIPSERYCRRYGQHGHVPL